jgi:hypothetical protein
MSDDRPKKTWSEIDKLRSGSGSGSSRRDKNDYHRDQASKTAAYSSYKSNLDKMFSPGAAVELPQHLKERLGPASDADKKSRALMDALKDKADAKSLKAVLKAGLALPEDARFLMKLLDLDQNELLEPVLEKLLDIVESGTRPSRMLLIQKIDALVMRQGDGPAVDLAKTLRSALA